MSSVLTLNSRLGQVRGTGDVRALFRRIDEAQVLTAYERLKVFSGSVRRKTITNGRSCRFKISGRRTAGYHVPGSSINNMLVNAANPNPTNAPSDRNFVEIQLDGLMVAPDHIYELDYYMEDTDYRADHNFQLGEALAIEEDKRTARIIVAAAQTSTEPLAKAVNAGRTGTVVTLSAGWATAGKTAKADEMEAAIRFARTQMRKKDVPAEMISQMRCAVTADTFDTFPDGSKIIHSDWNPTATNGNFSDGNIMRLAGFPVTWSNHVQQPPYTLVADADFNNDYATDLSKVEAIIWHSDCMAVLTLKRATLESTQKGDSYWVQHRAILSVASMAIGMGKLRPELAAVVVRP